MPIHRTMLVLARAMATLGGVVLTTLVLMTCVSVMGRGINTFLHGGLMQGFAPGLAEALLSTGVGPVQGDTELVEVGMAFAIFAFLPFCQITAGHATVDIFTSKFPVRVNRLIQMVVEVVFAAVLILIAWRLYEGMVSKMNNNETSFLLQFPKWWAYAASLVAAVVGAVVGVHMAMMRIIEFLTSRTLVEGGGAEH